MKVRGTGVTVPSGMLMALSSGVGSVLLLGYVTGRVAPAAVRPISPCSWVSGCPGGHPACAQGAHGDSSPFLTLRGERGGSWANKEQQSMERQKDLPWLSEASESR